MAYDKVVDSAALDAGLAQIAQAIREKGGTSASLAFPDAMAAAIAAIESGGGLPSGVSALASGTVTPSEDAKSTLGITHNLGAVPDFLVWWDTTDLSSTVESGVAYFGASLEKRVKASSTSTTVNNNHFSVHGYNTSGTAGQTGSRVANTTRMTATTAAFVTTTTYPIKAGHTYRWVCGVIA